MTYSFLTSDYSFDDLIPPFFRNNFDISHHITGGVSYQRGNLELSSGVNYRTGKPFTNYTGIDVNNEVIIYEYPNSSSLSQYFRLDFSANYGFDISQKLKGKVGIAVWNLTNHENVISSYFQLNDQTVDQFNQLALGITPNINFRIIYR